MRTVLFTFLGALLCGCGAGPMPLLKKKAPQDLSCAENAIQIEQSGGIYYAQGCGEIRRYTVPCNPNGLCFEPQGVAISPLLRKQAGFDLNCPEKDLSIQHLNADTFGVRGCDRQASYILLSCASEASCRVVQNTQTQ